MIITDLNHLEAMTKSDSIVGGDDLALPFLPTSRFEIYDSFNYQENDAYVDQKALAIALGGNAAATNFSFNKQENDV